MKPIIVFLTVINLVSCSSRPPLQKTGMEGKPMPSFNLLLSDSSTYINTKNIPVGEPVVLFFFGSHCPYSRAQMQEIISNMSSLKNVRFYAFTTESITALKEFDQQYHLTQIPNMTVGQDYTFSFANYYKVPGVPCLALFGFDKKLKQVLLGKYDASVIKDILFN